MRKLLVLATSALISTAALAAGPQFENLSKDDVKDVAREFAGTLSHTGVSAPETNGLWGVEVGVVAGQSKSPDLEDVVENSGGKGSDFKNLYHAGVVVRGHFPLDLFAEVSVLPEQEISDVKVKNTTFEVGWNVGGFFNLPLDLAVGVNFANSDISFKQDPTTDVPVETTISLETKTRIIWIGASKTFGFFTPYVKIGKVKSDGDLNTTNDAPIFSDPLKTNMSANNDGNYATIGANLQFGFFKLGVEGAKIMDVSRASAKLSLDF